VFVSTVNPLNAELNPIRHLLALLGAHHILHISRIRVNTFVLFVCFDVNGQTDVTGVSIVLHVWEVQSSQVGPATTCLGSGLCEFS